MAERAGVQMVRAFLSQLTHAARLSSLLTPIAHPERAYLMHWCCMVGDSGQDPHAIPPIKGMNIDWTHGNSLGAAKAAG
ncbi:MAG TPA: hypothetical protein VGM26_10370 [Rhizomicrobium sp.]|jgi:hypothetical protein